jgi:hypothetical protein
MLKNFFGRVDLIPLIKRILRIEFDFRQIEEYPVVGYEDTPDVEGHYPTYYNGLMKKIINRFIFEGSEFQFLSGDITERKVFEFALGMSIRCLKANYSLSEAMTVIQYLSTHKTFQYHLVTYDEIFNIFRGVYANKNDFIKISNYLLHLGGSNSFIDVTVQEKT